VPTARKEHDAAPDVDRVRQLKPLKAENAGLKLAVIDLTLEKTMPGPILDYLDSSATSIPLTHA
jgi:hypothetical protein